MKEVGYAVAAGDGTPIFYERTRAGDSADARSRAASATDVIVLSDGIGCDGYVWKYLARDLDPRFELLHWHYPGHGRSPAPASRDRLGIADLADNLACVLDDAGVDRAILFGHSMGVQVSLETYRRHPSRVAGLGLFCGAPGNPLRTFKGTSVLEQLLPLVRSAVGRAPGLATRLSRALLPTSLSYAIAERVEVNGRLLDRADFMPYLRGMSQVKPDLFLAMLAQAGAHDCRDMLPSIAVPTLVVAGSRDGFTPPELSTAMAEAIPGAHLLMVDDGSHTAPLERPHFVNRAVRRFLDRHVGDREAGVRP